MGKEEIGNKKGRHNSGRKPLGPSARTKTVSFVCSIYEAEYIEKMAKELHISKSQFICNRLRG